MSLNDVCKPAKLGDETMVCAPRVIELNDVVDPFIAFVDVLHLVAFTRKGLHSIMLAAFNRFIYVLLSQDATRSVEYTVRIQVLHSTVAHSLLFTIGFLLSHNFTGRLFDGSTIHYETFRNSLMVMLYTSARTIGAVFGFLMALTRFTAVRFPLHQNEIWTRKRLWLALSAVWLLTASIATAATIVQNRYAELNLVDLVSPLFLAASIGVYVAIIVTVRNTLLTDPTKKSFYRCLSRTTLAAFAICIAELIVPISRVIEQELSLKKPPIKMTLREYEYHRSLEIFSLIWNKFSFVICNSTAVWMYILIVPKFRFLFLGEFGQYTSASQRN